MIRAKFALIVAAAMLLIGWAAPPARADDSARTAVAGYGGAELVPVINRDASGSPLLPCPRSVPCVPIQSYEHSSGTLAAVPSNGLLPCPFSVPCLTTRRNPPPPVRRSSRSGHRTARPRPSVAGSTAKATARGPRIRTRITTLGKGRNITRPAEGSPDVMALGTGTSSAEMALRGDAAAQERARMLLREVELRLGHLDPSQLNENKSRLYLKASDLTKAGLKALNANDNLAALAFAEKARLLTESL